MSEREEDLYAVTASVPTRAWLERLKQDEPVSGISSEEIVRLIRDGRAERDEQVLRAVSGRD